MMKRDEFTNRFWIPMVDRLRPLGGRRARVSAFAYRMHPEMVESIDHSDRCGDPAVIELKLGAIDCRLVRPDRPCELADLRLL